MKTQQSLVLTIGVISFMNEEREHAREEATLPILDKLGTAINEFQESIVREFGRSNRITKLGILIAVISLFATAISVVWPIVSRIERTEKSILASRFKITNPVDGATVELVQSVRGETPFPKMNTYVIVTSVKTGDNFVVDGPVKIYAGILWMGSAKFGAAAVGAGEDFMVVGLATNLKLPLGSLTEIPKDAIFSEPIIVRRD